LSAGRLRWRDRGGSARPGLVASLAIFFLVLVPAWLPAGAHGYFSATTATNLVWSFLSPSSSPPALQNASAVYDSDNKTIVLFGGLTSQGTVSDSTWVWNGSNWTDYSPAQIEEPPPRYLASMSFDPALHQLILFGGRDSAGHELDDTWAWNGASWFNIGGRLASVSPTARDGAALSYDGQGHLILFGGEGPTVSGATPSSNASTSQSTSPPSAGAQAIPTNPPGPLKALGDTWLWGQAGWAQIPVSGPPPRVSASAAYDAAHGQLVMFGGASSPTGAPGSVQLGDTWIWNGSAWNENAPSQAPSGPPGRSSAVVADDPSAGGLVLSGGSSGSGPLADTWMWAGSGWSPLPADGSPGGRAGASGAFDAATHELVVFGGKGQDGSLLATTAVLGSGAPLPLGPAATVPTTTPTVPGTPEPTPSSTLPPSSLSPGATDNAPQRSRALSPGGLHSNGTQPKAVPVLRRGELVTLSGSGFSPNVELTISFHSRPLLVGRTLTDGNGAFLATVPVPMKASSGTHHFEASGLTPSGPATVVVATVLVAGGSATSAPSLAETIALLVVALVLPIGTWLLLGARSRIRQRAA
jgi:hypothetical protein